MVRSIQTEIINVKSMYDDTLMNLTYESPKDVRVNAIQTLLILLNIDSEGKDVGKFKIGCWCVNTEKVLNKYRTMRGLKITKGIDKKTWDTIFEEFEKRCKLKMLNYKNTDILFFDNIPEFYDEIKDKDLANDFNFSNNHNYPNYGKGEDLEDTTEGNMQNYGEDFSGYVPIQPSYKGEINYEMNPMNPNFNGRPTVEDLQFIINGGYGKDLVPGPVFGPLTDGGDEEIYYPYAGVSNVGNDKYDFTKTILANSIYAGNLEPHEKWTYNIITDNAGKLYKGFGKSDKFKPFFNELNGNILRKSKLSIEIAYGAADTSMGKKIIEVTPRALSQEVSASGEPICDVIEFVAKDIVEINP